jgi:hypothetical protein
MLNRSVRLALFALLVTCSSKAAEDPFVGDWKLNPARSNLSTKMNVESLGASKYALDLGGNGIVETIVADGTDQPGEGGTTVSVSVEGPSAWKIVRKRNGRMLLTADWSLSKDGNTLTDHVTGFDPKGSPEPEEFVFQRKGGGSGFVGNWVSTSEAMNFVLVLQIRANGGDGLSIIDSSTGNGRKVEFDGKDYRRVDEHTLEFTDRKPGGEIRDTQRLQLSPDTKTLTMTTRVSGQTDPQVLVFERS